MNLTPTFDKEPFYLIGYTLKSDNKNVGLSVGLNKTEKEAKELLIEYSVV